MEFFFFCMLLLLFPFLIITPSLAAPYCNESCGTISIPYPFGIQPHCGLPDHRISCTENSSLGIGPLPFLNTSTGEFQVLSFSIDSLIINSTYFKAMSCDTSSLANSTLELPDPGPYVIATDNFFVVIGCRSTGSYDTSQTGGVGNCQNACYNYFLYPFCNAYACCLQGIPGGAKTIHIQGAGISYAGFTDCGFSTVLNPDTYVTTASGVIGAGHYGLELSWGIVFDNSSPNCSTVKSTAAYACASHSDCVVVPYVSGYVCNCSEGYEGDGYRNGTGCRDIDECADEHLSNCVPASEGGQCNNTQGNFTCNCNNGYRGDGYQDGTGCTDIDECAEHLNNCVPAPDGQCTNTPGNYSCSCSIGEGDGRQKANGGTGCHKSSNTIPAIIGALSTAVAILVLGLIVWRVLKFRQSKINKAKHFENNGGLRLTEYISSAKGRETPRLFSEDELKKATQNFAEHLKLGSGGYGTVYKGILQDMTVVAVKRSNHSEQKEADQFINEVIILSQINHRNVVQLLGCCLETHAPLLVYEYISNGTLSEYLQGKDGRFLSWESRLTIALETAQALAYLHSSISTPVFHRDIKSSNILLDRTLTPKVSDFGISRLVPMDETHVSTVVQGTLGYLDPEYFQTFQLTDKSDVYSFGVVLLELITALKPVSVERGEKESNLAMLCTSRVRTGGFSRLIDPGLKATEESSVMNSINQVTKLATKCLRMEGHSRPSMKQVFEELLWIRGSKQAITAAADVYSEAVDEDERDALIPSSHFMDSAGEFFTTSSSGRPIFTQASTSTPTSSGLGALEMMMMGSNMEEGR